MKAKHLRLSCAFIFTIILFASVTVSAEVPPFINYQGTLSDDTGTPLPDGTIPMMFRIYPGETSTAVLWEENHSAVNIEAGIFNVKLGSETPNPAYGDFNIKLFSNDELWLEVFVDGEVMSSRQEITSVAFSFRAELAETVPSYSITANNLSSSSVTSTKIANYNVTSTKIATGAVTPSKLGGNPGNGTAGQILKSDGDGTFSWINVNDNHSLDAADGNPVDALYVDNFGRVGIGTTSPDEELVIGIPFGKGWAVPALTIGGSNGGGFTLGNTIYNLSIDSGSSFNRTRIRASDDGGIGQGDIEFICNGIGIGTGSPGAKLQIEDSSTGEVALKIHNSNNTGSERIYFGTSSSTDAGILVYGSTNASYPGKYRFFNNKTSAHFDWVANSGIKMTLEGNGDLGIGTTNPGARLQIEDNSTGETALKIHNLNNSGTERLYFGTSTSDAGILVYGSTNGTYPGKYRFFNNKTSAHFDWITSSGIRMTLDNSGDLGVGTTSPQGKLHVSAGTTGDAKFILEADTDNNNENDQPIIDLRQDGNLVNAQIGFDAGENNLKIRTTDKLEIHANVEIYDAGTKVMELGTGLDYAEGFDVSIEEELMPGTVLIIDPESPGRLTVSSTPYDSKVAGIIAGANGLGSGVRLGAGQFDYDVALAGRVYCNVDASNYEIKPGDLLTTSSTPGYAMKVTSYSRAQGSILGKAMEKLKKGEKGQILVLVTLQ